MNALDIGILVIVALCAWGGYRRGLIHTVYRLVSFFAALFLAYQLYPHVADFLRDTAVFTTIRDGIARAMNLETVFNEHAVARGAEIIDTLPLPAALRVLLHSHNTPDMYAFLQVATVEEYISGFFANMIINGFALLIVFMLAMFALALVGSLLDIVSMLPVVRTLNRAGGLALGLVMGFVIVWVSLVIMTMLLATGAHQTVYELLQDSFIASWIFESEFVLPMLVAF